MATSAAAKEGEWRSAIAQALGHNIGSPFVVLPGMKC